MKKLCQIEPKLLPNRSVVRPGGLQGLEGHPKAPKSTPKGTPKRPKGALGEPQGHPKSGQGSPKSAWREPKSDPERPLVRQNRVKVGHGSEKNRFWQKCSATRPCRCAEHFGPPEIAPKWTQNGPKWVLEPLEGLLRSLFIAQERFGRPRELLRMDFEPLRCPQKRFPWIFMILGPSKK